MVELKAQDEEIKIYHSSEDDYSHYEEASFFARLLAVVIDGFVLVFIGKLVSVLIALIFNSLGYAALVNALKLVSNILLPTVYQIFFLMEFGQTLGKMAMEIKVVYQQSNESLRFGTVILREPVGKVISSLLLFAGYLVVMFGKRAWHDNIADTKVIKIK